MLDGDLDPILQNFSLLNAQMSLSVLFLGYYMVSVRTICSIIMWFIYHQLQVSDGNILARRTRSHGYFLVKCFIVDGGSRQVGP